MKIIREHLLKVNLCLPKVGDLTGFNKKKRSRKNNGTIRECKYVLWTSQKAIFIFNKFKSQNNATSQSGNVPANPAIKT